MGNEEWKKIKEVLGEVLAQPLAVRQQYIDRLDIDDDVKREVVSLLDEAEEADEFLSLTGSSLTSDFFEVENEASATMIGQRVGIYRVTAELGFGGMGAVYLGQRTDGEFDQDVAIKMLKREYNTKSIRKSFARERQIQAALAHPNIASLIDAGTTSEGIPYLVMEYVEGEPIDEYCRNSELTLDERLKLFNKACDAVAFAHRNLIIHKDLKPSNILVTKNGEPKLLDFGIAKLLVEEPVDTLVTTGLKAMTPQYASPEQLEGKPITTATDVYSLGVILFKILTDSIPFKAEPTEYGMLEMIGAREPRVPSQCPGSTNNPTDFGADGVITPASLKGDIDNIILKSLRIEPEERYETVERFSDDIWRYLDGLPIEARPATVIYRAKKFYRRNRIPTFAGILTLLGLVAGITVAIWQADIANRQATIAKNAQLQAEAGARKSKIEEENAKRITAFMEKMISYANPGLYAAGSKEKGQARVIDVLNRMGDSIEVEFPGRKDLQAEVHHKFAEVYVMVANGFKGSDKYPEYMARLHMHARKAFELRKEYYGEKHELVAKDMYYLWASGVSPETSTPGFLARSINLMRETNAANPNLPNMLTSYAHRLYLVGTAEEHDSFLDHSDSPEKTGREVAETYLLEALGLLKKHNATDVYSIALINCRIASLKVDSGNLGEIKEFYTACKNLPEKLEDLQKKRISDLAKELEKSIQETRRKS